MPLPSAPTVEKVSIYLQRWQALENYQLQEASLGLLFKDYCPFNSKLAQVVLKVSALNDFYSTNIFDTFTVATHIHRMDIDGRLKSGDHSLVNELALVTIKNKKKNFYSFATKYCSHHVPDSFPIYDSFVEKILMHYAVADKFSSFRKSDLKQYASFVRVIREFQQHYALGRFSLIEIDKFLWLMGKEHFPRSYGVKKKQRR